MSGITGVLNLIDRPPAEEATLRGMLGMLRHRGPDEFGLYRDERAALGSARLSLLDLTSGQQPIGNEDGTLWMVCDGGAFNDEALRPALQARGHRFQTATDVEAILHLYEEQGPACLSRLNGHFALAIWDARSRTLFLARDRLGTRPLFYTHHDGRLLFGSEVKAILAYPGLQAQMDPEALDQVFTFWSTLSPRTLFRDMVDLPPGHYLLAHAGQVTVQPYWQLSFPPEPSPRRRAEACLEELESLLIDAVRIRLRADVPVGAYLSGGLDSSLTAAIVCQHTHHRPDTFSIAFDDPEFDESAFQQQMAAFLGTNHQVVRCTHADIGRALPQVIWHTEAPTLRTSPVPMFLLSQLAHDRGIKAVLTGEGADEFLAGYDIFKEMKIRRFWARRPDSQLRPLLLRRLYPDITGLGNVSDAYLSAFFQRGLTGAESPYYSHAIRWANTGRTRRFFRQPPADPSVPSELPPLPSSFGQWSTLAQAQYLEQSIFLAQYLLSSQGDRPAMAHSLEGRFPFLDDRVVEFCNHLPPGFKLHGLTEKWLLRQLGRKLLPGNISQRPKRPYRAPIHRSFFGPGSPDYVLELLSEGALRESGLFNPAAVAQLARKAAQSVRLSEVDDMALIGILSTQLWHRWFVQRFRVTPLRDEDPVKVVVKGSPPQADGVSIVR